MTDTSESTMPEDSDSTIPVTADDDASECDGISTSDSVPGPLERENAMLYSTPLSDIGDCDVGSVSCREDVTESTHKTCLLAQPNDGVSGPKPSMAKQADSSESAFHHNNLSGKHARPMSTTEECSDDDALCSTVVLSTAKRRKPLHSATDNCASSSAGSTVTKTKTKKCSKDDHAKSAGNSQALMTLPKFSDEVKSALENGTACYIINQVIEEAAHHVINNGDMNKKGGYARFGYRLVEKYPCLKNSYGLHPWSQFNVKLSQKIRNIRNGRLKKSILKTSSISSCSITEGLPLSIDEAKAALEQELGKSRQNWSYVVSLFRHLHADRRQNLQKSWRDNTTVSDILHQFPILSDIRLVREDFKQLTTLGLEDMHKKYDKMIAVLAAKFGMNFDAEKRSSEDEIKFLEKLEKEVVAPRMKSKSKFCTNVFSIQEAHEFNEAQCKKLDPPHLMFVLHEDGHYQGFILADEKCIPCCESNDGIFGYVIDLIACYYAWDLKYPREFQVLAFLQEVVLGDVVKKKDFEKKSKLIDFHAQFECRLQHD